MARSGKNQKVNTKFIQDIAETYRKGMDGSATADVVTFAEAKWGLNISLFPVQKFILKTFYGMKLDDDEEKSIIVNDDLNSREVGRFNEVNFMDFLIETDRINLREYQDGRHRRELLLCCGRRASKCHSFDAPIFTTVGLLSIEELYERLQSGDRIGINTFDGNEIHVTYDISMEVNMLDDCFLVETETGKSEQTNGSHPYLVFAGGGRRWVDCRDLTVGDTVACVRHAGLTGGDTIGGQAKAAISAFVCAHGNVTNNTITLAGIDRERLNAMIKLVYSQFPYCIFRPIVGVRDSYEIVDVFSAHQHSLTSWLNDCGFAEKRLPDLIKRLNSSELSTFLMTMFDDMKKSGLRFTHDDLVFLRELQMLLMMFGIEAKLEENHLFFNCDSFDESPLSLNVRSYQLEKIKSITHTGKKLTYALEVAGTNTIVNSIVTHNSSLASIISNYEVYRLMKMGNPQAYFNFPEGQEIAVTAVSLSDDNAKNLFNMIRARSTYCNYLKDRIVNRAQSFLSLKTDADELRGGEPSIFLFSGGAGSEIIRGHNNIVVIFDEAAFLSVSGVNSGFNVYQALTPSISSFTKGGDKTKGEGKAILLSSPFSKEGMFYEKYLQSFDNPDNVLMFEMYSAMVNPSIDSVMLRDEKRANPSSFSREYGAKFSDTISTWVDEEQLSKVVNKDKIENPRMGVGGVSYYMGLDYGGKNDGSSVAIVHKEGDKIILDYADVYYSGSSDVFKTENTSTYSTANKLFAGYEVIPVEGFAEEIKRLCELFPTVYGWFDQFNGYALLEILKNRGLTQFDARNVTASLNTQVFQVVKSLINSEMIELFNHPILIPEFLTLEEVIEGNQLKVEAPPRAGFHDDISDALARAVYGCYEMSSKRPNSHVIKSFSSNNSLLSSAKSYNMYHLKKRRQHGVSNRMGMFDL